MEWKGFCVCKDRFDNIEAFDVTTAALFAKLYKSFPKKVQIECDRFCDEMDIPGYSKEEKESMCKHTMSFLKDNGFIITNSKDGSVAWAYVTLTMKGLAALKSQPKSLDEEESVGKRLVKAIETGSMDIAVHMAQNALTALFRG